jgi:hypothetical protein
VNPKFLKGPGKAALDFSRHALNRVILLSFATQVFPKYSIKNNDQKVQDFLGASKLCRARDPAMRRLWGRISHPFLIGPFWPHKALSPLNEVCSRGKSLCQGLSQYSGELNFFLLLFISALLEILKTGVSNAIAEGSWTA